MKLDAFSPAFWLSALTLGSLAFPTFASDAKSRWFVDIRERAEYQFQLNDKFLGSAPKSGQAEDGYLLSRLRVGLEHRFDQHFSAKLSLQDSRVFGWGFQDSDWRSTEFSGIEDNPQSDPLELGETWLAYEVGPIKTQIGRQAIAYGNNRVFGPGAWKNSGKWVWDAAKLRWQHEKNWLEVFAGKTMLHDPNAWSLGHRHGFDGMALYGHWQATPHLLLEPMTFQKKNDQSADYQEKNLDYLGARLLWQKQGWKLDTTALLQKGSVTKLAGLAVDSDAYAYHVDLSYRFNPKWQLGSTLAFASGDDKKTAINERFDGAYGASDKYYGRMNLMAWSNLKHYGLLANYRPHRDWQFELELHRFYADQIQDSWRAYKNGLNASSRHYGDEVDLITHYQLSRQLGFQAGVGLFLPGKAVQQATAQQQAFIGDDSAYSAFFQLEYRFGGTF
ncbi:MAG: alginate export family protein [Thiotrichales bacterium]|nr:alginate export family protein [Thiotrichales bacterium]